MPQITLDLSDATELAETLAFITGWLSGSQEQILAESLAAGCRAAGRSGTIS